MIRTCNRTGIAGIGERPVCRPPTVRATRRAPHRDSEPSAGREDAENLHAESVGRRATCCVGGRSGPGQLGARATGTEQRPLQLPADSALRRIGLSVADGEDPQIGGGAPRSALCSGLQRRLGRAGDDGWMGRGGRVSTSRGARPWAS